MFPSHDRAAWREKTWDAMEKARAKRRVLESKEPIINVLKERATSRVVPLVRQTRISIPQQGLYLSPFQGTQLSTTPISRVSVSSAQQQATQSATSLAYLLALLQQQAYAQEEATEPGSRASPASRSSRRGVTRNPLQLKNSSQGGLGFGASSYALPRWQRGYINSPFYRYTGKRSSFNYKNVPYGPFST